MFAHLVNEVSRDVACAVCTQEIQALLDEHRLVAQFRPVADFQQCVIAGYIATVRGPTGMLRGSYERLTRITSAMGRLHHFTCHAFHTVLAQFVEHSCQGAVFIPLPVGALEAFAMPLCRELVSLARHSGLAAERIVLVLPEPPTDSYAEMEECVRYLHAQGLRIAARTLLCPRAGQHVWSRVSVDFCWVDEEILGQMPGRSSPGDPTGHVWAGEMALGRQVLADGIVNKDQLHALMQAGVRYGASHFIGRPSTLPTRALSAVAHKAITAGNPDHHPAGLRPSRLLERLLIASPSATPETSAGQVFDRFESDPDLRAVAVVQDGQPLGLISRYEMIDVMARSFRKEIFGQKPCRRFMDDSPLMVDINMPLEEVANVVVGADPRHLISGFVITERGQYRGVGWVQDLLREVTAMQMESARYANPLTQLPGNVPINQHIEELLDLGIDYCVVYGDLDNFKPFNDVYGYAKGDEVIQLTAKVLAQNCDPHVDYVGHIGGDDFILIFRSADWHQRCGVALQRFSVEIASFFSNDDLARGGYVTENRKGLPEFHPLISLSLGAVEVKSGVFANHLEVAKVASEVKKKAKSIAGNSLYVNQRALTRADFS